MSTTTNDTRTSSPTSVAPTLKILLIVALVLAAIRALLCATHGLAILGDSGRYVVGSERSLFDLLGWWDSRAPGFVVQVLYLLPSWLAAGIQGLLTGLAWGLAAIAVACASRRRAAAGALFAVIIALSFAPWIQAWDTAAMTEAFVLAGSVLCLSGLFLSVAPWANSRFGDLFHSNRTSTVLVAVGFLLSICTRATSVIYLAPLIIAVWWFSRRMGIRPHSQRSPRPVALTMWIAGALAIVFAALQSTAIAGWYAQNRMAARGDSAYLAIARESGMPACPAIEDLVGSSPPSLTKVTELRQLDCPQTQAWFAAGGLSPFTELTAMPTTTLERYVADIEEQWIPPGKTEAWRLSDQLFTENSQQAAIQTSVPTLTVGSVVLVVISTIAVAVMGRSRDQKRLILAPSATFGWILLVTAGYALTTWLQDSMEFNRHAMPASTMLPFAAVCATAFMWTNFAHPADLSQSSAPAAVGDSND